MSEEELNDLTDRLKAAAEHAFWLVEELKEGDYSPREKLAYLAGALARIENIKAETDAFR